MCCVVPAITLSARSDLGKRRLDHQLRRSCRAARPALACQLVHLVGIEHAGPGVGLTASAEYATTYIGVEARLLDPEPLGCLSRADPVRHSRSSSPPAPSPSGGRPRLQAAALPHRPRSRRWRAAAWWNRHVTHHI